MTRYEAGDVVLVRFPFTDLSSSKLRPAVIVSTLRFQTRQGDVVVLALTSQRQRDDDLRLAEWRSAGLPKPSWLKPVIGTLAATLIYRRLGRLNAKDDGAVRSTLAQLLSARYLL
jgi:mRNA interferase MazF